MFENLKWKRDLLQNVDNKIWKLLHFSNDIRAFPQLAFRGKPIKISSFDKVQECFCKSKFPSVFFLLKYFVTYCAIISILFHHVHFAVLSEAITSETRVYNGTRLTTY